MVPFIISSRLKPAIKVGDATISIETVRLRRDGRYQYRYFIDTPEFEYVEADIQTHKHDLKEALSTLLSFLGAAAEAYNRPNSDNKDLFPSNVMEWAHQNSDEISMAQLELE